MASLHLYLSLLFLLSSQLPLITSSDLSDCPPPSTYPCGNLTLSPLSHPFTTSHDPYCEGLRLDCDPNNNTIVTMQLIDRPSSFQFQVLGFDNSTQTITLTPIKTNSRDPPLCDPHYDGYFSIPSTPWLSFTILNGTVHFRCKSNPYLKDHPEESCEDNNVYGPYQKNNISHIQDFVSNKLTGEDWSVLPVTKFALRYQLEGPCNDCTQKGGWCSYNNRMEFFCVPNEKHNARANGVRMLAIVLPTFAGIMLLLGSISCYFLKRRQGSGGKGRDEKGRVKTSRTKKGGFNSLETNTDGLRAFSLCVIKESTDNFAFCNKLGHGGYGPVYKGSLKDGQVIAVKRLSDSSKQGLEEFENEVTLLARLQHVNLVRILGFCTEGGEKMLIYEYMPNGSLDSYLFDPVKRLLLDWKKRIQIVEGVIQGLLYLQEYSRLSIIHRDIKPSNVLLDIAMTPKIADFGMARIFQKNDPEANTGKIVGTYGYVPPEYATRGAYSVKLDVYSFGVLLLQVISGKTIFSSYGLTGIQALSHQAYEMWEEGKGKEFMDPTLDGTNSTCGMTTCLQVALLCVQDDPEDRPTMLEVSSLINSEIKDLPIPNIPAFSVRRGSERLAKSSQIGYTVNEATISEIIPR